MGVCLAARTSGRLVRCVEMDVGYFAQTCVLGNIWHRQISPEERGKALSQGLHYNHLLMLDLEHNPWHRT